MFYLIAVFKQGENFARTVGYRLFNVEKKEVRDVGLAEFVNVVKTGKLQVENVEFDEVKGGLVGTQGSLSRYPQLPSNTKKSVNKYEPLLIVGRTPSGSIMTVDYEGRTQELPERMIIHQAKFTGLSNAKLVPKDAPEKEQHISAIVGTIAQLGDEPKSTEKVFDCPNTAGQTKKWMVRLVKKGEKYGNNYCLTNDGGNFIEFYDMTVDKRSFPIGQFVSRYYLETLVEDYESYGLNLYGDVSAWNISAENYKPIKDWLRTLAEELGVPYGKKVEGNTFMDNKKKNMAYWDEIEGTVADVIETLASFGGLDHFSIWNQEDGQDFIKEVTELITNKLAKDYKADFPYVDENY